MTTRFKMILGLVCCAALLWGCGARWVRKPVVEQQQLKVSLEHKVVDGEMAEQPFNHPFELENDKMRVLLDHLQYLKKPLIYGDAEEVPVFQRSEIERLVPTLVDALGRANPNQRVRFVSYNTGGGLLFKKQRRTGGVIFVDASDRLNLAFSYINYELKGEEIKRSGTAQLYTDPLTIDNSDKPVLAPGAAVYHRMKDGKKMPMWVVADIDQMSAAQITEPATPKAQPSQAGEPVEPAEEAPAAEYPEDTTPRSEQEPAAEPEAKTKVKTAPESDSKPSVSTDRKKEQWEKQKTDIRQKLKYLKELREADLIDEKEYEAQKEKLLEQIR